MTSIPVIHFSRHTSRQITPAIDVFRLGVGVVTSLGGATDVDRGEAQHPGGPPVALLSLTVVLSLSSR